MRIPKRALAVADVAAHESAKYPLQGVKVERNGSQLSICGTDGRRLLKVEWTEQETAPLEGMEDAERAVDKFTTIVPARALKQLGKMIPPGPRGKNKTAPPFVVLNETSANGHVSLIHVNREFGQRVAVDTPSCEGQFPPVNDVIPKRTIIKTEDGADGQAVRIGINARLLIGLLEAMIAAIPDDNETVIFEVPTNPNRPIKLTRGKEPNETAIGVLMPVIVK